MSLDSVEELMAESQCGRVLVGFYRAIDEARFSDAAIYFAEDAEWHRRGVILKGRKAVEDAYKDRGPEVRTRHLLSNLMIDVRPEGTALFSLNITFYMGVSSPDNVPTVSGPSTVLYSFGELRRDSDWRIARKETRREFNLGKVPSA